MKQRIILTLLVPVFLCGASMNVLAAPTPAEVKAITKRVADWQLENLRSDCYKRKQEHNNDLHAWTYGACFVGLDKWAAMAGDEKYYDALLDLGSELDWELGKRIYHADDHLVGRLYMQLAEINNEPAMYAKTKARLDFIIANPSKQPVTIKGGQQERWTWCDALFMSPPIWAQMSRLTGDAKYLNFMVKEYKATYDHLYDPETKLFFRDANYFKRRDDGRKVFWSRGNGWVFGGLALIIDELPEGKDRDWFVALFKDMAPSIAKLQTPAGHWAMSLLYADKYPAPETSGSSFFTYGFAWGINQGFLDQAVYEPVVIKGWNALVGHVTDEGMLGYVQPVGGEPGKAWPDLTEVYGIGAFLSAGSEVYKMVGGEVQVPEKETVALTTFMKDGGWCWYQDPRAIIHDGKLFMGTVKGNGGGPALVGVYDLAKNKPLGTVLMQDKFDRDDHNSPVFHVRPDGSMLATYARHNRDRFHYSRISDPSDPLKWSDEFKQERNAPNPKDKVTYMNLYELKKEGKLYNLYRNIDFNPTFVTSTDHGETWSEPVHFFQNEVGGRHRPYARYAGNGEDTISVSITDAHPRNYGNNIYYFEFSAGNFYKADGTLIKSLKEGPLLPSESEMIYRGSETKEKPDGFESVPNSAWTSSIAIDANGYPHIAYTLYLSNTDHRYRIASWDGTKWNDREVAFAGKCLYDRESSYTGLITLDPTDPTRVAISSDVDPKTGEDLGGMHEIYVATVGGQGDASSVKWKAVTSDSKHRNLRPILVAGEGYKVLLWLRGTWNTYTDYDVDVVGIITEHP